MVNVFAEESLDSVVLRCVGSLVLGDEAALLCPALKHRDQTILLDLSLVDRIDAAGIGALIALQAAGIYLKLVDPSKPVAEVLRLTKVDSLFEVVHGSESEVASGKLLADPLHHSTEPASA